jgi:IS5 family transposase
MYIVAYPPDVAFLNSPLVHLAYGQPKFQQMHDLLAAVWADKRIQLAVRQDLAPPTKLAAKTGAPALAAQVTVSLAVVRRLMGWGYRTLASEVAVSAGWRWVCGLYYQRMPNFRTIQEREAQLRPQTVRLIHRVVLQLGQRLGVTTGQRLRVDSSVTETDIHYPTDSSLLDDAARVLSRLVKQVRVLAPPQTPAEKAWYRDRHKAAHRLAGQIGQFARRTGKNTGKPSVKLYAQLLTVVEALLAQVAQLQPRLATVQSLIAQAVQAAFDHYLPLVHQVVAQTRQRVLENKPVAATTKVVSLFEPHTALICRGKAKPKDTEFGRRVWFSEVDGGLITEWDILAGNPSDTAHLIPSLKHHRHVFGKAPHELSGDRGVYSAANERAARALGVRHVSLPKPGHTTTRRKRQEKQGWFRAAQRFRNGIEGRISQLRRARHLTRCLNHGEAGMERWVGWGVIANNLAVIALYLIKHRLTLAEALCPA